MLENSQKTIGHKQGQYRAELFEEIIYLLLMLEFTQGDVFRHYLFPKEKKSRSSPVSIDFVLKSPDNKLTLVEAKATYEKSDSFSINRILRGLKAFSDDLIKSKNIKEIVLALASGIPPRSLDEIEKTSKFFNKHNIKFNIWDNKYITNLLGKYKLQINDFSVPNLEKVIKELKKQIPSLKQSSVVQPLEKSEIMLQSDSLQKLAGKLLKMVVLIADFSSYTKFVHASEGDRDLVTSIMGRFYRETRQIVTSNGGIFDKFIGDGILAYWESNIKNNIIWKQLDKCISELIAFAISIANEWQDHIDLSVTPKGLKAGAAIGSVLFIPEGITNTSPIHAIGDCINLAARLQNIAKNNTLVISNKLRKCYFEDNSSFVESSPIRLKNIGEVLSWVKNYEQDNNN